jgi:hypothetical protein
VSVDRDVKISHNYERITVRFGDKCMKPRKVSEWEERLREGRKSFDDARPRDTSNVTR